MVSNLCGIRMVIACVSSLAAIQAQWIISKILLRSMGYARPTPNHLKDKTCPIGPKRMSRLWDELRGACRGGCVVS